MRTAPTRPAIVLRLLLYVRLAPKRVHFRTAGPVAGCRIARRTGSRLFRPRDTAPMQCAGPGWSGCALFAPPTYRPRVAKNSKKGSDATGCRSADPGSSSCARMCRSRKSGCVQEVRGEFKPGAAEVSLDVPRLLNPVLCIYVYNLHKSATSCALSVIRPASCRRQLLSGAHWHVRQHIARTVATQPVQKSGLVATLPGGFGATVCTRLPHHRLMAELVTPLSGLPATHGSVRR